MKNLAIAVTLGSMLAVASPALGQDVFDLEIGDVARRASTFTPQTDVIVATADGAELSPEEIAARLADTRLLLIGESHTTMDFHRIQARVLRALQATGRSVLIGLEMFPVTEQPSLDRWNAGDWTDDEFVTNSEWYQHWGYNWLYYREIFEVARSGGSHMFAINAPRASVTAVRQKGLDGLTAEEQVGIPPRIDTDDADHLHLFKSYFADDTGGTHGGMTDEMWQSMFAAQCTWDGAMAWNAVQALESAGDPDAIMVVIVGSGHVAYGLGIARQAADYFEGEIATLIPVPVSDSDGEPTGVVRGSYADFVWGIPGEAQPLYPSLGLSVTDSDEGLSVLFGDPESLGGKAGIAAGDKILTIDGWTVPNKLTYNRIMADKRWGDHVELVVERAGARQEFPIALRRN
ncbi:MAG: PDZ domain-containing protein [Acidobacteria bacterium]|nr:PDZ domain-containing protein [Acidobacteriota bacterium]